MLWWQLVLLLSAVVINVHALSTVSPTASAPTKSPLLGSRTTFSNRDRLDQLLLQGPNASPNFPRTWIPLASVEDLDPDRPTPLEFLGSSYVCFRENNDDTSSAAQWVVMDNACAHRLAPLSEGRIERSGDKAVVECSYHGWSFDSQGQCQRIPQLDEASSKKARANPQACVASYPTQIHGNVLWAWLWSDDPLSVAHKPSALPEGLMKGVRGEAYTRDFPYGWDTLLENLVDPAHVPFAHHNLQGTRNDAIPILMSVPTNINENGFEVSFQDRTMQMKRQGRAEFRAPYGLHYVGDFLNDNGDPIQDRKFELSVFCVPTRPGQSRVLVITGTGEPDDDNDKPKKNFSILVTIFKLLPRWLVHIFSARFLDSDLAFLHYQERESRSRLLAQSEVTLVKGDTNDTGANKMPIASTYYMPAPADRCIAAMRRWIRTYASAWESQPLPPSPNRDQLFDRKRQHVDHCVHCQGALAGIAIWRRNARFVLAASLVGMPWSPLASLPAVGSLLLMPILDQVESALTKGGYDHYKS